MLRLSRCSSVHRLSFHQFCNKPHFLIFQRRPLPRSRGRSRGRCRSPKAGSSGKPRSLSALQNGSRYSPPSPTKVSQMMQAARCAVRRLCHGPGVVGRSPWGRSGAPHSRDAAAGLQVVARPNASPAPPTRGRSSSLTQRLQRKIDSTHCTLNFSISVRGWQCAQHGQSFLCRQSLGQRGSLARNFLRPELGALPKPRGLANASSRQLAWFGEVRDNEVRAVCESCAASKVPCDATG